ncbi:phage tail tape measure protein [bacterium]|nr:phage tail tape measure protein [bacterium]
MGAAAVVLGTGLFKAAKSAVVLDNNMRKVQARITGIRPDGLKQLNALAIELGGSTRYTIGQVSSLMATMAQAGIGVNGIKQMTAAMLDFATATGVSLDEASAHATAVANAFGLEHTLENITRITDTLTFATINAQVNITDMGEAMAYASKDAKTYNQSIETTAMMLAMLGNVGIKGSAGGTALRAIFRAFNDADSGLLKVNGSVISLIDNTGNLRQLPEIFGDLNESMKSMTGLAKAQELADIFGRLGLRGGVVGMDEFQKITGLVGDLSEIEGLTKKVALTMDAGIGGTLYRVASAFDKLAVTIGNSIIPYIDMFAKGLTGIATTVAGLMETFNWLGGVLSATFLVLAGGAISLLAFAGVTTVLAAAFAGISSIITGIGAALGVILTPVGLIVAGVVLIGTTLLATLASFYDFSGMLDGIAGSVGKVYSRLNSIMGDVLSAVKLGEFTTAWELMLLEMELALLQSLDSMLGNGWEKWFLAVRGYIRSTIYTMKQALKHAVAAGMGIAAAMRGDGLGAAKWLLEFKGITNKDEMKQQMLDWWEQDQKLLRPDTERKAEIDYLKETLRLLKDKKDAIDEASAADKARYDAAAKTWIAPGSEYSEFPQSSNADQAKWQEEYDAEWAKKFEKVRFDERTTFGAVGGGSVAEASSNMAKGLNAIMKEQLGTLKSIEKIMKKDRPLDQQGIWAP